MGVEEVMTVDPKHHKYFVARRGEVIRRIGDEFGGVVVSFPRQGVATDKVTLKGAKDCVEAARNKILETVEDLESQCPNQIPRKSKSSASKRRCSSSQWRGSY